MSEEFLITLDSVVENTVKAAILRADKNGRKTLQPQDL